MLRSLPVAALLLSFATLHAREYVVPAGADVGRWFTTLPKDATAIRFSDAAEYRSTGDIELPDATLLVVDGAGCTLQLGPESRGFTRAVVDQADAMRKVSSRYVFRDFASISGGRKGIDLQATLGSNITDCRFNGQTETAIDLRFCLMARLQNVLVTLPGDKGIVVRQGDWPGATWSNSQSNSTVLEQCRVFASKSTTTAYTVLHANGVRLTDCISEGGPVQYDLYLSAAIDGDEGRPAGNTVVKAFTLDNFHVEHRASQASLYINMPARATVDLGNVYWNSPQTAPVIRYVSGQLNIDGLGWWNPDFRIHTRSSAPRINVDRCNNLLQFNTGKVVDGTKAGALEMVDPLPGNTRLSLDHVRLTRPSM